MVYKVPCKFATENIVGEHESALFSIMSKVSHRQLCEHDAVESEVFVVDRIQSPPHHPGLDFVLLFRQKLELHVGIAGKNNKLKS